jgi:hypothetical protein
MSRFGSTAEQEQAEFRERNRLAVQQTLDTQTKHELPTKNKRGWCCFPLVFVCNSAVPQAFLQNLCRNAAEPLLELERVCAEIFCCDFFGEKSASKKSSHRS